MILSFVPCLVPCILVRAVSSSAPGSEAGSVAASAPVYAGDPDAALHLEEALRSAMISTEGYGPWPEAVWRVFLHEDARSFERATQAPPARAAQWEGTTLHLRPWDQLRRREVGAVLRHELVHRRLARSGLRRWEEEARCIWAEQHVRLPKSWPQPPAPALRDRLDRALASGTTRTQAWAYQALRAWVAGKPLPAPPAAPVAKTVSEWKKEAVPSVDQVTVCWPSERLPAQMIINGHPLSKTLGKTQRFEGRVSFGAGSPVAELEGRIAVRWLGTGPGAGWRLTWTGPADQWVANAVSGELGDDAPFEARRALAAVLESWLAGHPRGHHPDGSLCPLTHCAVVRGPASESTRGAARSAPELALDPQWALFTSSKGGVSWSVRQVWGRGPTAALPVPRVEGDKWLDWDRTLSAAQVRLLKREVRPGVKPGQEGIRLGASGPYAVEALRLAAGRAFGWTAWPSNACAVASLPDGGVRMQGHGWGHNTGLCLATAVLRARQGWRAEAILEEAFGPDVVKAAAK